MQEDRIDKALRELRHAEASLRGSLTADGDHYFVEYVRRRGELDNAVQTAKRDGDVKLLARDIYARRRGAMPATMNDAAFTQAWTDAKRFFELADRKLAPSPARVRDLLQESERVATEVACALEEAFEGVDLVSLGERFIVRVENETDHVRAVLKAMHEDARAAASGNDR